MKQEGTKEIHFFLGFYNIYLLSSVPTKCVGSEPDGTESIELIHRLIRQVFVQVAFDSNVIVVAHQ